MISLQNILRLPVPLLYHWVVNKRNEKRKHFFWTLNCLFQIIIVKRSLDLEELRTERITRITLLARTAVLNYYLALHSIYRNLLGQLTKEMNFERTFLIPLILSVCCTFKWPGKRYERISCRHPYKGRFLMQT